MSGTTTETASGTIPTGDQGSVRADCPTCGRVTTLARCGNENVFRCIECKALYTGEMLAADEMLEALKGIEGAADEFVVDIGADLQEGRDYDAIIARSLAKWSAVRAAIVKAEGKS